MAELVLETARLRLRPYRIDDLDALVPILGDPEHMRYYPHPFSRAECRSWIRRQMDRYERDGFGLWAMDLKETGEFAGNCGLTVQVVEGIAEVEVGWHVKPELCGRGLAPEAGAASLAYGFDALGLERIISLIRPENRPSWRVAEKLGMTIERHAQYHGLRHRVYVITPSAAP